MFTTTTPSPTITTTTTSRPRPPENGPVWTRRLVVPGTFTGLVEGGGSLYSMKAPSRGAPSRGTRVVRFDPATRRVVACSAVVPGATALAFVDNKVLFVAGVNWVSKNVGHIGPPLNTASARHSGVRNPRHAEVDLDSVARTVRRLEEEGKVRFAKVKRVAASEHSPALRRNLAAVDELINRDRSAP